jgi:hypothetical protein
MRTRKAIAAVATFICSIFICSSAYAAGSARVAPPSHQPPASNDWNWLSFHIIDSFYPMTEDRSFAENLNSIEVMFNYYYKRKLNLDIGNALMKPNPFGTRSREGHYIVWLHFSDRFLRKSRPDRRRLGDKVFLYQNSDTDILTGWSGSVNLAALLRQGIEGFTVPVYKSDGRREGGLNSVHEVFALGESDAEGGWFLSDEQMERVLDAVYNYRGWDEGYAFMMKTADRPSPFEPAGADLMNGYNCGDFAFELLVASGVISREEVESLKIKLWYPTKYYDRPLPLSALGQKGKNWLDANPQAPSIPDGVLTEIAWFDLLFNPYGVEFFQKQTIFSETWRGELVYKAARVWDQERVMAWLKVRSQFASKGVISELKAFAQNGTRITEPYRLVAESYENRFHLSNEGLDYRKKGVALEEKKLKRNGIIGEMKARFRRHLERYKIHL